MHVPVDKMHNSYVFQAPQVPSRHNIWRLPAARILCDQPMGSASRHSEITTRYPAVVPQLIWLWQQQMTEQPKACWIHCSPNTWKTKSTNLIFRLVGKRQWLLQNILEASQTYGISCTGFPGGMESKRSWQYAQSAITDQRLGCPAGPESH